jgi:hypothetical protein
MSKQGVTTIGGVPMEVRDRIRDIAKRNNLSIHAVLELAVQALEESIKQQGIKVQLK